MYKRQGKISDESPVGRALMGAKIGETVTVEAPIGNIDSVSYTHLDVYKRQQFGLYELPGQGYGLRDHRDGS